VGMVNYNYLSKQINHRWIYGSILLLLVLGNKQAINVAGLSSGQVFLSLGIFFFQYFLVNGLFAAWIGHKRYGNPILAIGMLMDIILVSGINYIMGGSNFSYTTLYLIPLLYAANNRAFHNFTYVVSLITYTLVGYLTNLNNFFSGEIISRYLFNMASLSFFFLIMKSVVRNTISETKEKMQSIIHDIRNSLTVILGYITVLSTESVGPEEKQQYFDAMELATLRIRNLCDQFSSMKSNVPLKVIPEKKSVISPINYETPLNTEEKKTVLDYSEKIYKKK